jgi:hypothetical protein
VRNVTDSLDRMVELLAETVEAGGRKHPRKKKGPRLAAGPRYQSCVSGCLRVSVRLIRLRDQAVGSSCVPR